MSGADVHPTAWISSEAQIEDGCRIGPFAVVEPEAQIGPGCEIGAHAVIKRFSILGKENRVAEGAVIGGLPQDLKYQDCRSYVRIGEGNVFREHVTVNRSTREGAATRIGDRCFLMAYSHVAHECELGNAVVMANNVALAGHTSVADNAFISGGVVIHQFCRVGRLAMVGGNSKVEKDVPPFFLADGVPARLRGLNLVGLRRAGFRSEVLRELKTAYRILASRGSKSERLAQLALLDTPLARELAEFVESSQRGYCRTGQSSE